MVSRIDDFGTPAAYNHYAVGWAHAMDTPYQWTKQVASHWGGTRNGTIVHWPNGIEAKGEIRSQFHHVIDVAPTVLEAAGLPEPLRERRPAAPARGRQHGLLVRRRGAPTTPHDPVLRDVLQPRHLPQGLDGGDPAHHAVGRRPRCRPSTTTCGSSTGPTTGRRRTTSRPSSPRSSPELQRLFLIEAASTTSCRSTTGGSSGSTPTSPAGPPHPRHVTVPLRRHGTADGEQRRGDKNKSHAITAQIEVPEGGANGVIVAQGGAFGGFGLYAKDGRPRTATTSSACSVQGLRRRPMPAGEHQVRMEFTYDGGGLARAATSRSTSTASRSARAGSRARSR